jgi:hypothetical protein
MALRRARLARHVDGLVIVYPELKVGEELILPADRARQLADSGVVELIADEPEDLEAAQLRSPRKRG